MGTFSIMIVLSGTSLLNGQNSNLLAKILSKPINQFNQSVNQNSIYIVPRITSELEECHGDK